MVERTPEYYKQRRLRRKKRKRERWKNSRIHAKQRFARNRAKQKGRIAGWRTMLKKYVACQECGISYPPERMSFDHVRGEKKFNISQGAHSYARFWQEVGKCDIVCRWCHDAREYFRGVFKSLRDPVSRQKWREMQKRKQKERPPHCGEEARAH